jgi:aminopeptidase-like protein/aminoglycoside N3'-acetyltransferase
VNLHVTDPRPQAPVHALSHSVDRAALVQAFHDMGIGRGDLLYLQVCADEMPDGSAAAAAFCEALYSAAREVLGDAGTLFAPTYTFSFCRQQDFDPDATPTVGGPWNTLSAFPEYVRRLPGAIRSSDPIFSTAGIGPAAAAILTNLPPTCLGPDCVHDRLRRAGGKICLIGVGLYEAIFRHYVEAQARVPWRFDKLFIGTVVENGVRRQEGWIYNVRILDVAGDPAGEGLEQEARARGLARVAQAGELRMVSVECEAFHALALHELTRDPWFTAKGPPGDPVAIEAARVGEPTYEVDLPPKASMMEMIEALWHLPRHIMSGAYDAALAALATQLPMTIHAYPSGLPCWTWLVPEKWTCHEAFLETLDGRRLFSTTDHALHVVSYSLPFEGIVGRDELFQHLHVHPRLRDAVPFVFKYYERDWGLCCSQELRESLTDDAYRVVIRSTFSLGTLKVGEIVAPGQSEDTIVLCAHLCHPAMVNDDLTGVVVGMEVMRALRARSDLRYTYRLLLLPETIGSIAFLSQNEHLIPRMRGGLFLEMLGMQQPHALQQSFDPQSDMDQCLTLALAEHDPTGWTGPFRTLIGNDERQFNAPGVRVPMLSLSRVLHSSSPEYPYREYHSSRDDPSAASSERMAESRDLVLRMIDTLERNRTPVNQFKGEVFLARYGLFVNWYEHPAGHRAVMDVLYLLDGRKTVAQIAAAAQLPFETVYETIERMRRKGLVRWADAATTTIEDGAR